MIIPNLGNSEWKLTIQDVNDESIPEGASPWRIEDTVHPNRLVGIVKRYGRHNGGTATWHVIPFTSVKDGSKWWSLYVS